MNVSVSSLSLSPKSYLLLLLQQGLVDRRHDAATRERHVLEQAAEVVVVAHRQRHGARVDALALARRLRRQLHQLRRQVLERRRKVHLSASADAAREAALAQHRADAPDREDEAGAIARRGLISLLFLFLPSSLLLAGLLARLRGRHVFLELRFGCVEDCASTKRKVRNRITIDKTISGKRRTSTLA